MGDEIFHQQVLDELNRGRVIPSLWRKAGALTSGGGKRQRLIYTEMRVTQLARDTRKVKIVSAHRHKSYGINVPVLLLGWVPFFAPVFLSTKEVSRSKVAISLVVPLVLFLAVLAAWVQGAAWMLWAAITAMLGAVWMLSQWANRWIVESIEPLKSVLRDVHREDLRNYVSGRKRVIDKAVHSEGLQVLEEASARSAGDEAVMQPESSLVQARRFQPGVAID